MKIRDRIKDVRRVKASELLRNPRNWGTHPAVQARALRALLTEIGYADALIARELPDGRLQLIDGHLRAETTPDAIVPVLVLDVSEEEADKLLLTLDPLAAMATADNDRLKVLLVATKTDDAAIQELLRRTAGESLWDELYPPVEPPAQIDKADELQKEWHSGPGQLWQCRDGSRLLCGDATNRARRDAADGRRARGSVRHRSR